jgi:hypothetical protein
MYIEDILHLLVDSLEVSSADVSILTSISRQVKKGNSLTDKQHALVKTKLLAYKEQFEFDIELHFDSLRMPLRIVDRSQYIKIVSTVEMAGSAPYEARKENWKWIKIKFPFAKKTIQLIEKISNQHRKIYSHKSGTHEHYFRLTENTVKDIVEAFVKKQFEIDPVLLEYYDKIKAVTDNKEEYLVHVKGTKILNLSQNAYKLIYNELGAITESDLVKLVDRKRRYGIDSISADNTDTLVDKIAFRNDTVVNIDPAAFDLNKLAKAIVSLDRFPLLVVIDHDAALEQVSSVYDAFSYFVPAELQTVLFRVDTTDKYNLNNFIQDNKLNNWLDNSTKIVYINKTKLPKLLVNTEWKPVATLTLTGVRSHTLNNHYINDMCDLIVCHDKEPSLFRVKKSYDYM